MRTFVLSLPAAAAASLARNGRARGTRTDIGGIGNLPTNSLSWRHCPPDRTAFVHLQLALCSLQFLVLVLPFKNSIPWPQKHLLHSHSSYSILKYTYSGRCLRHGRTAVWQSVFCPLPREAAQIACALPSCPPPSANNSRGGKRGSLPVAGASRPFNGGKGCAADSWKNENLLTNSPTNGYVQGQAKGSRTSRALPVGDEGLGPPTSSV
jgi:hypothetical protein